MSLLAKYTCGIGDPNQEEYSESILTLLSNQTVQLFFPGAPSVLCFLQKGWGSIHSLLSSFFQAALVRGWGPPFMRTGLKSNPTLSAKSTERMGHPALSYFVL